MYYYYDMFLNYIIISIILSILVLHGYNKVRHKFWMIQPIFYRYNLANWIRQNRIYSIDRPTDTLYLNFINNIVTHITDTNNPIIIDNIYINETERSINYYEDIVKLMNRYPYYNKQLNNGNKSSIIIDRKMNSEKLKRILNSHDYNAVITMNRKSMYKTDISTSEILSIDTVMGVIISIPYYCRFEVVGKGNIIPVYYSALYYDPQEIKDKDVMEMIQTNNYKIYDDWDKVLIRQLDYRNDSGGDDDIESKTEVANHRIKKDDERQAREIMRNSNKPKIKNKNTNTNTYQENGLNISKYKTKIYASIYRYTGVSIPKVIVPFVIFHRFYIPISSQPSQEWQKIEYRFHPSIQLIKIGTQNVTLLYDFLESCYEGLQKHMRINTDINESKMYKYKLPFKCCIIPSLRHIFHMIKMELCSIYVLIQKNNDIRVGGETTNILSMYMFSNSDDTVSNNMKIDKRHISYLTTSVMYSGDRISGTSSFIYGFINALKLEAQIKKIGCVAIDTLSHNKSLIDFLIVNNKPLMVEKNNLIFYNYICNTLPPEDVMIMN